MSPCIGEELYTNYIPNTKNSMGREGGRAKKTTWTLSQTFWSEMQKDDGEV